MCSLTARVDDLKRQIESTGLIAFFVSKTATASRITDALQSYWRLRFMKFPDDLCRKAVVTHLDNHDLQVEYILSHA